MVDETSARCDQTAALETELHRVAMSIETLYAHRTNASFTHAELARYRQLLVRERELRTALGLPVMRHTEPTTDS